MCVCEDRPCCGCHLEEDRYPIDPLDFYDEMEDKYQGNIPEEGDVNLVCLNCNAMYTVDYEEVEDFVCEKCEHSNIERIKEE